VDAATYVALECVLSLGKTPEYILSRIYPHVVTSVLEALQMEVIVPHAHTKDRGVGLFRLP
jgi:hypothetical protein